MGDVTREMVSYDKVDPLPTENPFYYNKDSAINKFIDGKEKKFPYIRMTLFALFIPLMAFIMGMFYIGGIWNPVAKIKDLHYIIYSEDAGCMSQHPLCAAIHKDETTNLSQYYTLLNGQSGEGSEGGKFEFAKGTLQDAIDKVEKHEYWVGLYIPKEFTISVLSNLNAVNNNTLNNVVVDMVYDEARSYTTVTFIKKAFDKMEKIFFDQVATTMDKQGTPFNPPFLIQGIEYKEHNLHPVTGFGQNFATFVSFILVWIGTMATALITHFIFPLENHWIEKNADHAILKTMSAKIFTSGALLFIICVIVSIIPLCCGKVTMFKGYAAVLFFFFFFSFTGLGINNCLIHLFHFINFYLIACTLMMFQLISCGGIIHRDIQYGFFKLGKVFPMFYAVRELKYIYFGSGKHTQATNIIVIFAWAIVSMAAALFLYYIELKVKKARFAKGASK